MATLLYRRDSDQVKFPPKDQLNRLEFKCHIAQCLCTERKAALKRKGRPSTSSVQTEHTAKTHRGPAAPLPVPEVRKDGVGHWPVYVEKKGRCKRPGCKGIIKTQCIKCCASGSSIYLCVTPQNNCFVKFHTE